MELMISAEEQWVTWFQPSICVLVELKVGFTEESNHTCSLLERYTWNTQTYLLLVRSKKSHSCNQKQ